MKKKIILSLAALLVWCVLFHIYGYGAEPAPLAVQKRGDGSSVMIGTGALAPLLVIGPAPTGNGMLRIAANGTLDIQSGAIVNFPTGFIPWAAVSKTGSSLADLATRSAADLSSGTILAARMPALTGDATSTVGTVGLTLATVNSNVGTFAAVTVNGKGLVTAAVPLSGDLTTSGAVATLATVNSTVGTFAATTINAKGLATAGANLSGDLTTSGAVATLATVATGATTGGSTAIPVITFNNKGLVTAVTTAAVVAPAGTLTGTTLASNVVTSSLTTVGTIGTGVWQGTVVAGQYGGTGVANTGKTITLGGNLTTSGAFATTLTATNTTTLTLPTTGTLATLAGSEALTNKTYNGNTWTAGTGTLTQAAGSSLITVGAFASTFTFTGTTGVTFPTSGTLATTAGTVASITGTAGQVLANGLTTAQTGAVTLTLPTALTGINSITSVALSPLVLATGTSGTALTIASATNNATFTGNVTTTTTTGGFSSGNGTPSGNAGYSTNIASGTNGGIWDFARTSATARTWRIGVGLNGNDEFGVSDQTAGVQQIRIFGGALSTGFIGFYSTVEATTGGVGALTLQGGLYATKAIITGSLTASTSTSTGSIVTGGGVGIGGSIFAGVNVNVAGVVKVTGANGSTATSTSILDNSSGTARILSYGPNASTNGAFSLITLRSDGSNTLTPLSVSAAGAVTFGSSSPVTVSSTTTSTTSATGALIVSGGAGIAGNIFSGGTVTAATNVVTPLVTGPGGGDLGINSGSGTTNVVIQPSGTAGFVRVLNASTSGSSNFVQFMRNVNAVASTAGDGYKIVLNPSSDFGATTFADKGPAIAGILQDTSIRTALAFYTYNGTAQNEVARFTGTNGSTGNMLIGGTTDITGSGGLKIFGSTASTSTTTGSLIVAGGVGAAGAGWFGGAVNATSSMSITGAAGTGRALNLQTAAVNRWALYADNTSESGGDAGSNFALQPYNDAGVLQSRGLTIIRSSGKVTMLNDAAVSGTTASTSTSTGALTVGGGLGVAGAGWFSGAVNSAASSTAISTVNSSGAASQELGKFLAPNLIAGTATQGAWLTFGQATSTNNAGVIQFSYSGGAGSAANTIGLALYGQTVKWSLDGSGNVSQTSTTDATTGGAGSLITAGGIYAAKKIVSTTGLTLAVGAPISLASGTGTRAGNATLVGGTVTVSNTTVTANTIVILTRKTSGGTIGTSITYTVSAGTSFTINSDNILDTSTFSYLLIENP